MNIRAAVVVVLLLAVLGGCAPATGTDTNAGAVVDEKTLDTAIVIVDEANKLIDGLNAGWPEYAVSDQITLVDGYIIRIERQGGAEQLPEFYEAITSWRSRLDDVGTTSSDYLESRNLTEIEADFAAANSALDDALDAAGR
ncbi:MAG: hypothetical protein ACYCXZ_06630 [Coriobacteriia bacterium]